MADKIQHQGLIDAEEKNALILEATGRYVSAVEGLGQGTQFVTQAKKSPQGGTA